MFLEMTYEVEFDELIGSLREKYGEKIMDMDGIGKQTDMSKFSRDFFAAGVTADASIDANANVDDMSVIAYSTELPKPFFRLNSYYVLWKELFKLYGLQTANDIIEMQLSGQIYVNDFHGIGAGLPYCFNYSCYDIMMNGLPMVKKIKSDAPKYLYAFKSQLEQFTVIASNSTLGATGLADLLVVMSYYAKNILEDKSDAHFKFASKKDCWTYIKENLVSLIYTINQPMRANQSPFTNVSIYDKHFLESVCGDYIFPDGSSPDFAIVQQLQELFLDIMNEEMQRTPITFPVVTACFSLNKSRGIKDKPFARMIADKNREFGFINIYCGDSSTLSSCCRLRSDTKNEYFNSFGSGSSKIGSLGVCTVNMPRLAREEKTVAGMLRGLERLTEVCAKVNNAKREIVRRRIENGNLPLYTHGYMELGKQYSTCGVNGLNEAVEILGKNILEKSGQQLVLKMLKVINTKNEEMQELLGAPHNCEQIPGENVSIKLAAKDRELGFNDEYDIYSNQFIPLVTHADMLDRLKLQGLFDKHFSGGAICHINVDTKIEDADQMVALIEAAAKMGVVYWAVNYNIQRCEKGHMSVGKGNKCAICGATITDNFTRVVGFLTNTKNWHKVRREEDYPNREFYNL